MPGGHFEQVKNLLPDAPELQEHALEAEGIGEKPEPEKMAVTTGHLCPNRTKVPGSRWDIERPQHLDDLGDRIAMLITADTANPLTEKDVLGIFVQFASFFYPTVAVSYDRNYLRNLLIFVGDPQLNGFR